LGRLPRGGEGAVPSPRNRHTPVLCRELTLRNEHLRLENRIRKEKVAGRLRFTDEERQSLAEAALPMGRSLMKEVVGSVTDECLDHLLRFGTSSLQRALRICRDFSNGHRPHQGMDNRVPDRRATEEIPPNRAGRPSDRHPKPCRRGRVAPLCSPSSHRRTGAHPARVAPMIFRTLRGPDRLRIQWLQRAIWPRR